MKTLSGLIEAGEQLTQQAIDTLRRYHEAQEAGRPANEVERCAWRQGLFTKPLRTTSPSLGRPGPGPALRLFDRSSGPQIDSAIAS
ncbi:hypothetical protein D3C77_161760 [compost metagenome]